MLPISSPEKSASTVPTSEAHAVRGSTAVPQVLEPESHPATRPAPRVSSGDGRPARRGPRRALPGTRLRERIWQNRGTLLMWGLILFGLWFVWPDLITPEGRSILGTTAAMILQILFVILLGIAQFAAIMWFVGRPYVYWVMPGEVGVTFDDVKGAQPIVEVARRIVVLLRGVKKFKDMGGEVSRGLLLVGPPGTGKCVTGDTIVFTEHGMVPIGAFAHLTDQPDTYKPFIIGLHGLLGMQRSSHFYYAGRQPTLRVTTRAGYRLEGTPDHPVVAMDSYGRQVWRTLGSLRPGDHVAIQRGQDCFGSNDDLTALNLAVAGFDTTLRLPPKLGPDEGYLLGILTGDGTMRAPRGRVILTSADQEIVDFWRAYVERLGLQSRTFARSPQHCVNHVAFKAWLLQLGLSTDTAAGKQVPHRVMTASKPVVRGFLQGLFDTDGTVDRRCSYIEYYSSSERLIREVQVILLNFGIVSRLLEKPVPYKGERRPAWRLTISGEDAQAFYREIGFRLTRKQSGREGLPTHSNTNVDVVPRQAERLIELRQTVRLPKRVGKRYERIVAGLRAPSYRMLGQFLSDVVAVGRPVAGTPPAVETVAYEQLTELQEAHHLWDPVAEIVPGEAEVYDFTIPMFHSFVSNGFISHNSYLAQAISSEAGVPFCYASAPSFQSMWFGVSNLRVMWIYRRARKLAQKHGACIIFIDEIDAIGMSRSGQTASGAAGFFGAGLGLLNELLLQMDPPPIDRSWWRRFLRAIGLRPKPGQRPTVLTVAATNLPHVLDPALLRPGRFDRQITVDLPDLDGRREIIEYYLSKVKHRDMPVDRLAAETIGYSPVRIKHVINEAVVMAHFAGRDAVTYEDFVAARDVHEFGLRQPIRNMSKEERRRIAYHEAGHAVAQVKLLKHERIVRATIVRHGQALGFVSGKPLEERYLSDKDELLAEIQVYLASRAAEKICLQTELTGVTDDLRQATRIAAAYLGFFGMGDSLYSSLAFGETRPTAAQRADIEKILKEQYRKVEKLLRRHRPAVDAVAQALIEREELTGDEVIALVEAAPVDETVDDVREERGIGFRLPPAPHEADEPSATPAARADASPPRTRAD